MWETKEELKSQVSAFYNIFGELLCEVKSRGMSWKSSFMGVRRGTEIMEHVLKIKLEGGNTEHVVTVQSCCRKPMAQHIEVCVSQGCTMLEHIHSMQCWS